MAEAGLTDNDMKARLFLVVSLFLYRGIGVNSVWGQSRFSISLNGSPVYTHAASRAILPIAIDPAYSTTEIVSRTRSLGYSFGLMGHYHFSSRWSASMGIWATSFLAIKGSFSMNGTEDAVTFHNNHPFRYGYRVPVLLNYQASSKRISPYFSIGTSVNFRQTSYAFVNGQEIPVKIGRAITSGPLLVGAGAIFQLKPPLSLLIQPMLEYSLKAKPNNFIYSRSYTLNLQAQMRYRF